MSFKRFNPTPRKGDNSNVPTNISKESAEVRDTITAIVAQHPEGISPSAVYLEIYGKKPDLESYADLNAKQRIYYWLKSLAKSKHLVQFGKSHASMYKPNKGRPTPDVSDIPIEPTARRPYTKRAAAKNGNGSINKELIAFVVSDLRDTLSKLERLVNEH